MPASCVLTFQKQESSPCLVKKAYGNFAASFIAPPIYPKRQHKGELRSHAYVSVSPIILGFLKDKVCHYTAKAEAEKQLTMPLHITTNTEPNLTPFSINTLHTILLCQTGVHVPSLRDATCKRSVTKHAMQNNEISGEQSNQQHLRRQCGALKRTFVLVSAKVGRHSTQRAELS